MKGYSEWGSMQSFFCRQFRGKTLDDYTWVYGRAHAETYARVVDPFPIPVDYTTYYISIDRPVNYHGDNIDEIYRAAHFKTIMTPVSGNSICQSTGMYDKNNKLIYEGDFIRKTHEDGTKSDYLVYYIRGYCNISSLYTPKFTCGNSVCNWEQFHYDGSIEVIGNRFDNDDLRDEWITKCKEQLAELGLSITNQFEQPERLDMDALKDALDESEDEHYKWRK